MAHAPLLRCLEEQHSDTAPRKRNVRSQQMLALCGPIASGKTFLFEQVIAPVLGGSVVDAYKAFCVAADGFAGELLNGEVWKIHETVHTDTPR